MNQQDRSENWSADTVAIPEFACKLSCLIATSTIPCSAISSLRTELCSHLPMDLKFSLHLSVVWCEHSLRTACSEWILSEKTYLKTVSFVHLHQPALPSVEFLVHSHVLYTVPKYLQMLLLPILLDSSHRSLLLNMERSIKIVLFWLWQLAQRDLSSSPSVLCKGNCGGVPFWTHSARVSDCYSVCTTHIQ